MVAVRRETGGDVLLSLLPVFFLVAKGAIWWQMAKGAILEGDVSVAWTSNTAGAVPLKGCTIAKELLTPISKPLKTYHLTLSLFTASPIDL